MERTERERRSYPGKIQDELAEKHIIEKQFKNACAEDLERGCFEAAQMRDMMSNARSGCQVVSQVNVCIRRPTKSWARSILPKKSCGLLALQTSSMAVWMPRNCEIYCLPSNLSTQSSARSTRRSDRFTPSWSEREICQEPAAT